MEDLRLEIDVLKQEKESGNYFMGDEYSVKRIIPIEKETQKIG